jgi:putative transposase
MPRSKFSEEPIVGILREEEGGAKTADVCRRHGIGTATFHARNAKYGGMEVSDAKRLKAREGENAKLKRLLRRDAGHHRAEGPPQPKMMTPTMRRNAVAGLLEVHGTSERRACSVIGADGLGRDRRTRPDDAALRTRMRELAAVRRRFGAV